MILKWCFLLKGISSQYYQWVVDDVITVLDILLSVEEPIWDLVLPGVLHDGDDLVDLLLGQLSGTLGEVDVGLKDENPIMILN